MNNFSVSFWFFEFLESWERKEVALDMFSVSRWLCCCTPEGIQYLQDRSMRKHGVRWDRLENMDEAGNYGKI